VLLAVGAGFALASTEHARAEAQAERVAAALLAEAEAGWPVEPASVPAMQRWLDGARALGERRQATLDELAAWRAAHDARVDPSVVTPRRAELDRALARQAYWRKYLDQDLAAAAKGELEVTADDERELRGELARLDQRIEALRAEPVGLQAWVVADPGLQAEHDRLQALAEALDALANPSTGRILAVERSVREADSLPERTLTAQRAEWDRARAAIAAPGSPYRGLQLVPQLGLVPLGPDPSSGLWEFWHVLSGARPQRDATGRLAVTDDTGIVLVLVPGGSVTLGAQAQDPSKPRYDPQAASAEGPPDEVELDPYFISKYELTEGQWLRATGDDPSLLGAPSNLQGTDRRITQSFPVEQVSCPEAERVLGNWGLQLPTEAQWEAAARGGTTTVYWWGDRWEDGQGCVNYADQAWERGRGIALDPAAGDDGYALFAPVDALRPNPFGLHHVLGNVEEWCADWYAYPRDTAAQPGSGRRDSAIADMGRAARGGSSRDGPAALRCAARSREAAGAAPAYLGVRPARRIER